jgi:sulfite reductase (NADPH) flavoprotein alpha-component
MSVQPAPFLAPVLPQSLTSEQGAAFMPAVPGDSDDGAAPWHDPTIPLAERMDMAAARPLRRRMMAAMAQQDCGQCGYNCEDYSNAIFARKEERLNLCQPGGKETLRMLKKLAVELEGEASALSPIAAPAPSPVAAPSSAPGRSREHPVDAVFLSRTRLNKESSAKETWHVEFQLPEGLDYNAGDSFGVMPVNEPSLVDAIMTRLMIAPARTIGGKMVRDILLREKSLGAAPDVLFALLAEASVDADEKGKLARLAEGEDPDGDLDVTDVLAALEKSPATVLDVGPFLSALDPLQPRLYSISSSPKASPGRLTLTVDAVRYDVGWRTRYGVASTFLAERIGESITLPVYVQKAHGFALPQSGDVPIIMVGPGTGIAPFRAFLQERLATSAKGGAWLFFGHQKRDSDFFYEDELAAMKRARVLSRLSLAWSRDGADKIYVQDRMREEGAELYEWLERGAHFYVCGDAKRMAADVDKALHAIVKQHRGCDAPSAKAYIATLKAEGRYQADVY